MITGAVAEIPQIMRRRGSGQELHLPEHDDGEESVRKAMTMGVTNNDKRWTEVNRCTYM